MDSLTAETFSRAAVRTAEADRKAKAAEDRAAYLAETNAKLTAQIAGLVAEIGARDAVIGRLQGRLEGLAVVLTNAADKALDHGRALS